MSDTLRFNLPLLDAAQAQKHVTVNEALARADALASARVESRTLSAPPSGSLDGEAYIVGTQASGEWSGQDGDLALSLNGGWDFVKPWSGCTVWIESERSHVVYDDGAWVAGRSSGGASGAVSLTRIAELDQVLSGAATTTGPAIPDKAVVLGVTGRVIAPITGATAWSLGVPGSPDRYGTGFGSDLNAFAHGVTGQPQAYFGATPLEITSEGGDFTGGEVRLAVHYLDIVPPSVV
ncbi:MAG: DUF2793 domain-containing protein [Pseudomonadota bacterium]